MSTQETAALIESVNQMTATVAGKMGQIDQKVASAQAQFDEWRQLKDVIGDPGGQGTMRLNIFQGFIMGSGGVHGLGGTGGFANKVDNLGQTNDVYIHFKTPLNVNNHDEMFWLNIKGYSYGSACIIDETIVGYCYIAQRNVINKASFGNLLPDSYIDSQGNVIVRIKLSSVYFTTLRIDTMRVGTSLLFETGSLDVKLSLAETIDF